MTLIFIPFMTDSQSMAFHSCYQQEEKYLNSIERKKNCTRQYRNIIVKVKECCYVK